MNNEREKIAEIEALLRSLLQGKFSSLTIGFNDDHACNYQTAAEWDEYEAGADSRLEWVSEIERERARSENSVWSIQWYPDTPIGFHALAASSLSALIQGVRDHLSERNTQ